MLQRRNFGKPAGRKSDKKIDPCTPSRGEEERETAGRGLLELGNGKASSQKKAGRHTIHKSVSLKGSASKRNTSSKKGKGKGRKGPSQGNGATNLDRITSCRSRKGKAPVGVTREREGVDAGSIQVMKRALKGYPTFGKKTRG